MESNFCVQRSEVLSKYTLHVIMFKTILLAIFNLLRGSKFADFQISAEFPWNEVMTSNFSIHLCQPILNYCRKFEDIKFNIFEDMTLQSQCNFWDTRYLTEITWSESTLQIVKNATTNLLLNKFEGFIISSFWLIRLFWGYMIKHFITRFLSHRH